VDLIRNLPLAIVIVILSWFVVGIPMYLVKLAFGLSDEAVLVGAIPVLLILIFVVKQIPSRSPR
jgi:hypothetical protein